MTKPPRTTSTAVAVVDPSTDRTVPDTFVGKLEPNYYCRAWNEKRQKYCRSRAGTNTTHKGVGRCNKHGGVQTSGDGRLENVTHGRARRYAGIRAPRIREILEQLEQDEKPLDVVPDLLMARSLMIDFIQRYDAFAPALIAWYDTWEGKYLPLNETEARAIVSVLDEYEVMLAELGEDATVKQHADLQSARTCLAFLTMEREVKPRHILDISDAVKHADTLSKIIHRAEQIRQHGTISIERIRLFMLAIDRVLENDIDVLVDEIRNGQAITVERLLTLRQQIRKDISAIRV